MAIENIDYENLHCSLCRNTESNRVAWILYPVSLSPEWVESASAKYQTSIAVVTGIDWDNALTPWAALGVPKGSPDFKGEAEQFLIKLTQVLLPLIEEKLGCTETPERTLIGVSLSGLFTLWQWAESYCFRNIATLSGSFWYMDFVKWIWTQPFAGKTGRCFMLLGEAESHSKNPVFATVEKCTEDIAGYLRRHGIDVSYKIVKGNHYQYPIERLDMAMSAIYL